MVSSEHIPMRNRLKCKKLMIQIQFDATAELKNIISNAARSRDVDDLYCYTQT